MDLGIADRTAVVTGRAGRIGSEDGRTLAQEGVEVVGVTGGADLLYY